MKRRRKKTAITIWSVVILLSRILYLVFAWNTVRGDYEGYQQAIFGAGENNSLFSSGLSFAYSNFLEDVLVWSENKIFTVFLIQWLMQLATIVLLFGAFYFLCGLVPALVTGTVWAFLPNVFWGISMTDPFSYYMIPFSALFFLLSYFYWTVQRKGWLRSSLCELYLMILGFGIGVICIWNYIGWILFLVIGYGAKNSYSITRRRVTIQKESGKKLPEREQMMSTASQIVILFCGALFGMYCTLMKYTGITGMYLADQVKWWLMQYRALPGVCQEIGLNKAIILLAVIFAAAVCGWICGIYRQRKEDQAYMKKFFAKRKEKEEISQPESFVTEDGRTIEYLKNPLPVPKRHVAKEMQFEFELDDPGDFDIIDLDDKTEFRNL